MKESWADSIRFSLAVVLATVLLAIAVIAPLIARNEKLKQICFNQQLNLIELEAENQSRELFAKRLEKSPGLLEQNRQTEQYITIPEALAIHPEQMLLEASKNVSSEKRTSQSKSKWLKLADLIAVSAVIQQRLLIAAFCLLFFGIIPSSYFRWRSIKIKARKFNGNFLSRYRPQKKHSDLPSPHWETSQSNLPSMKK